MIFRIIKPPYINGAHDQDRTGDLILTKDVLYRLSYVGGLSSLKKPPSLYNYNPHNDRSLPLLVSCTPTGESARPLAKPIWSGKRDSNPRPSAWKADALATELLPLIYHKTIRHPNIPDSNLPPQQRYGGGGRVRTSVGFAGRFTVCSL
jgi:hypothetical protein